MAKQKVTIPDNLSISDCWLRIDEIQAELLTKHSQQDSLRENLAQLDREIARLQSEKQLLENRASALREKPTVSDHALLRYLERKYDFDSAAVRREILTPEVLSAIKAGASGIKSHDGTFKISETVITTYIRSKKS